MVDIEADGPCPGLYSMISIGAVKVDKSLSQTFYGTLKPIVDANYNVDALKSINVTREETLNYDPISSTMKSFQQWVEQFQRPMFISDNNGFDWQFVSYYFICVCGKNPFGHSSSNLGSMYKGLVKDTYQNFKHLRKTKHTHNALDDAKGNAEALLYMKYEMGLNINLD